MLNKQQLRIPLTFYRWCSKVGFLILSINAKEGKIGIQKDKYRVRIWKFLLFCLFLRGLYGTWRFVSLSNSPTEKIKTEDVPFLILLSGGLILVTYFSWNAFIRRGQITCLLFNTLDEGHVRRTTWKTMTLQEIVVLTTPGNVIALAFIYMGTIYMNPNAAYTLHSSISKEMQNELTKIVCMIVEVIIALFNMLNLFTATSIVMLDLQKCIEEGDSNVKLLQNTNIRRQTLNQIVRNARHLQLHAKLHNEGYRNAHFFAKILALSGFIVMESYGIILLHQNPKFAQVFLLFGFEYGFIYCILYHKAFKLPILVNKIKTKLRNLTKSNVLVAEEKKILLAKIKSLPVVSIKSGSFNSFEKMSTPNFFGFGTKQVIRILIAHRKPN